MPKICILIQVYNSAQYLDQCISSVLSQTFKDFHLVLFDNGSTDGSSEMIDWYATQDDRIEIIHFPKNEATSRWLPFIKEQRGFTYFTRLDSDDWWEPDYLERLVSIAEETGADMVCTGTRMHIVATGAESLRAVEHRLDLASEQYADYFYQYHVFLRTTWGKLFRMSTFQKAKIPDYGALGLTYGGDTIFTFAILRASRRLVLDNSVLHHYRVHPSSVSYQYNPRRFDSDVYLYNNAIDFLSAYGPVSEDNRFFLARVYANAVYDTANVIRNAQLTAEEKLREYRRIAENPISAGAFRYSAEDIENCRRNMIAAILDCADGDVDDFHAALKGFAPKCAPAVTPQSVELLRLEPTLAKAVFADDAGALLEGALALIRAQAHTKKYDMYAMVSSLSADKPLLKDISDKKLLRRHGELYLDVWQGRYAEVLDTMTGLLLDGEKAGEAFLQLYLSLAALQGHAAAFVFGKTKQAELRLRHGDKDGCRALLDELDEMGVEENEELAALRGRLNGTIDSRRGED